MTYPVGTVIDCGMQFDSFDTWSTSPVPDPNGFDVQGIATHEGGHFIGVSHSTLGDFAASNPMSATMLPVVAPGDANPRTLEEDDKASILRLYARNRFSGPIPQTVGGRALITLRLLKGGACAPATGVSVVAYRTQSGINGTNRVETFSGSQLRAFTPHQPFDGSVTLNVPPLPPGESYTIYARTLETGQGELSSQRYNYTTINSNLLDPQGQSRTFDHLATASSLTAGETRNLGDVGILGCSVADPNSPVNLVAQSITAPATAYKGTQIAVSSTFSNQGTAAAGAFAVGVYFSTDQTINASDIFSGFSCAVPNLAAGAVAACNGSVPVPSGVAAGNNYYVGLLVDRQMQVVENSESDNGVAAANTTAVLPNPLDPIVNGSFETGDLTGWTVKELTPASNPNLLAERAPRGRGVSGADVHRLCVPVPHHPRLLHQRADRRSVRRAERFQRERSGNPGEHIHQPPGVVSGHHPARDDDDAGVRLPGGVGAVSVWQHSTAHLQCGNRAGWWRAGAVDPDHPGRAD